MNRSLFLVDDDAAQVTLLTAQLERAGFSTRGFTSPARALEAIRNDPPDGVVTDLSMPEMSGMDLLAAIRSAHPTLPVIVVTGMTGDGAAEEAIRAGATDFLNKPVERTDLITRVRRALDQAPAQDVLRTVERQLFDGIVGSHPRVEEVREFVRRVAAVPRATALLLGESGTGKNLVARGIHREGKAARFRIVEINCAALPAHLIEAELFGHEKGAFTDAREAKKGLVEVADGGTLFLDEIGTLSLDLQAKLLSFLESRTFRRLGSTKESEVDLRIVAATNADLEADVRAGRFREDLWYRLNVASIRLPALRDIRSDIPELTHHFLRHAATHFGKPVPVMAPGTFPLLMQHDWPGNARELRNVVERAVIFSEGGIARITLPTAAPASAPVADSGEFVLIPRGLTLDAVERRYIEETLRDTGGKVEEAAARLGVTRKVLWSRRKKLEAGDEPQGDRSA